jgi:hypothetical protein
MPKLASERAEEFRKEWETRPEEEKEALFAFAKTILNQILNFYLAAQDRNGFVNSASCQKENCPMDVFGDPVWQSLRVAILAIEDRLSADAQSDLI